MADDNSEVLPLVSVLSEFESTFDHPESYLKPPATLQKDNLIVIKQIFDFCKKDELCGKRSLASTCPLQELLVENFDDEQIWQEIELQNTPFLRVLKQDIQSLKENGDKLSLLSGSGEVVKGLDLDHSKDEIVGENTNGSIKRALGSDAESDSNNEELSADENYDDQMDNNNDDDNVDDEEEEEGESANDDDINNASKKVKFSSNVNRKQKPPKKKSQVDDTFFKLSDMLQFLDKEDKKFERAHQKKSQKESDDDDDDDDDNDDEIDSEPVDYFIDMDSDDAEEDEDEEWNKALGVTESLLGRRKKRELARKDKTSRRSAGKMKYADFFDPPDGEPTANKKSGEESEEDDDDENEADEEMEVDEDAEEEEEIEDDDVAASSEGDEVDTDEEKSKTTSNFEKKQQKLKQKIEKLEKANLAKKPWQMSGEAGGKIRPINSLLEEDVSFDHTTTSAPDITEETTQNLEDIMKQRIKDEAWDDVERKVKPVTEPYEYKKKVPLDQEKSKLSLSQIYEQEYLKQTQAEAEEKENEEHVEVKALMTKLFTKLDALSNFHFTPKPPKPELKIVSNVPVISVEEVAPVSVSDAMMLAPEEVHEKKKEQIGNTEQTDTDRKRERRAKKRRQHERAEAKEKRRKLVEKLNPGLGNKHSKMAALKKLEKDHKSAKNVSVLKDEGNDKPVKSSAAFFSRLQDEVRDQVKEKKERKRKKEKSAVKVSQLKL